MDLFAGYAFRQFQKELARKIGDRGIFGSFRASGRSAQAPTDPKKYDEFLDEEQALHRRRMRKNNRQNLAWVVACMLMPALLFILGFLFFSGIIR